MMDAYNRAGENRRFVLATGNRDKVTEIRQILHSFPFDVTTMHEEGFRGEIVEDGDTYEANARIKALTVHDQLGGYVMADDSGLSIDALDGAPGIHSARFAGEDAGYPEKIEKIWAMLRAKGDVAWTAAFHCAIVVVRPDRSSFATHGVCRGIIIPEMRGDNGFGYDPIFYVPEFGCTTAEMTPAQKHRISHRGLALRAMVQQLRREEHEFA